MSKKGDFQHIPEYSAKNTVVEYSTGPNNSKVEFFVKFSKKIEQKHNISEIIS